MNMPEPLSTQTPTTNAANSAPAAAGAPVSNNAPVFATPQLAPALPPDAAYAGDPNFGAYPPADGAPDPTLLSENLTPFQRFWRRYGGSSFIISIGVHIILIIFLFLWVVVPAFVPQKKPEDFASGAGGGNNGDTVSMKEHRVKPKNAKNLARSPMKIVSKSVTAVTLPDMPSLSMNALTSATLAGSVSKGSGGGAGGGIGTGIGPGRGNGKNMVSLFGVSGFGVVGLEGTLYDIKRSSGGSAAAAKEDIGAYLAVCRQFINGGWNTSVLAKHWHAPNKLQLQQVLIPLKTGNAEEAPESFGVKGQMQAKRWVAHYKGRVTAPFSGKMRFVGMADDWITVRWAGKNALVSGYGESLVGSYGAPPPKPGRGGKTPPAPPPPPGVGDTFPYGGGRPDFQTGPWLTVTKGSQYNIEVAMGETPGGEFCATLAFQRDTKDAPLLLFRMSGGDLPTFITDGSKGSIPANVDKSGGGFVWTPIMAKSGPGGTGSRLD